MCVRSRARVWIDICTTLCIYACFSSYNFFMFKLRLVSLSMNKHDDDDEVLLVRCESVSSSTVPSRPKPGMKEIAISFQHRSCGYNAPICTGGDRRSLATVDRDLVVGGVRAGQPTATRERVLWSRTHSAAVLDR